MSYVGSYASGSDPVLLCTTDFPAPVYAVLPDAATTAQMLTAIREALAHGIRLRATQDGAVRPYLARDAVEERIHRESLERLRPYKAHMLTVLRALGGAVQDVWPGIEALTGEREVA